MFSLLNGTLTSLRVEQETILTSLTLLNQLAVNTFYHLDTTQKVKTMGDVHKVFFDSPLNGAFLRKDRLILPSFN